ncbi:AbrB/MazE/SpoVT family DNA-binding domain-containing protein [Ottowia beijingensis]|uniref:AbrB/MazE/SpoVT family DNA-binding domain-containing protein n=1 Tax=Ottowia beijingensis TaxID=1207057 RepID=A0A853IY02_9BURK|nr:AbrB/MazE/SpoVT family DNA-binding domain-containing protein [Ottowia beijingensis]
MSVGRWGNSLAVRLPAELARELGLREGSTLQLARNADQSFTLSPAARASRSTRPPGWRRRGRIWRRCPLGIGHPRDA